MKQFKFLAGAAASILLLFTSCLGDTSTTQDYQYLPGVVTGGTFSRTIVETQVGRVYSEQLNGLFNDGDCMLISFQYDSDDPNNANEKENGYSYVKLLASPTPIDPWNAHSIEADTSKLMDEAEIPLLTAVSSFAYTGKHFFLTSGFSGLTDQKNDWFLYFDPEQEPVQQDGKNVYTFVMRAIKRIDGKTPSGNQGSTNAFKVGDIVERINVKEQGNSDFAFTFLYLEKIEDNGDLTWKNSEQVLFKVSAIE